MQPVLPRTMVRGPAAFTISLVTTAVSQPWQVRWPEVKCSSRGSFFTPLNMSSLCGALWCVSSASSLSVVAMVCPSAPLLAQPDPLRRRLRGPARGLGNDLAHLPHVRQGDLAAAQAADEP